MTIGVFTKEHEGMIINGQMGPVYRRLKLLDLLRVVEKDLDPKVPADVDDYQDVIKLRKTLQGPTSIETVTFDSGFELKLPRDEWEAIQLLNVHTAIATQWMWRDENGYFSLWLEPSEVTA